MTSVVVGVVVRVLINVLCSQNEKLAASALGLWDGFAVYQAHLDNSLLDVGTLLQITLGFLFDFLFFGSIVRTVAYCAWLLLGILASDFGPDLWYDFGGEDITKDFRRELNTLLSYISLEGDNGSSRRRNRSRSRSPATSVGRKSEGETTVRGLASTSGTSRRRRSTRRPDDQSTVLTRDSRVTFDETSIAQSQTEESSIEDGGDTELQSSTDVQGLYMEPSTAASHLGVRSAAQSLLRRMYDDDGDTDTTHTQTRRRSHSSISRSGGGDTTPRGNQFGLDMKQGESSRADTFSNIEFPVPSPVARVDDVLGSLGDVTHMPEPMIVPTDGESALGTQTFSSF